MIQFSPGFRESVCAGLGESREQVVVGGGNLSLEEVEVVRRVVLCREGIDGDEALVEIGEAGADLLVATSQVVGGR